jgi:septal ring factor EnvC (AmiA/AmiB activator)
MSDSQGDRLIEEQQTRLKELDNMMLKYEEDRKQLQAQLNNLQNNIEDYNNVNEEQKNRIIRECVKRVDIDKDGITSVGKYIDIYMIDGTKHSIHMSKKGNNFITKVIYKDKERPLDDLQITVRFIRKKY